MIPKTAKPVLNCPHYYIDIDGSVYSSNPYHLKSRNGIKLKLPQYPLKLSHRMKWRAKDNEGKYRNYFVHLMVLSMFVGPRPTPLHQARHLDGDRYNNNLSNLEWGTPKENCADRTIHGTAYQKKGLDNPRLHSKLNKYDAIAIYQLRNKLTSKVWKRSQCTDYLPEDNS